MLVLNLYNMLGVAGDHHLGQGAESVPRARGDEPYNSDDAIADVGDEPLSQLHTPITFFSRARNTLRKQTPAV